MVESLQEVGADTSALTERLVCIKIDFLTSQIGNTLQDGALWPRLTLGFDSFWNQIRSDETVFTAILSSGHQAFIQKTFEVHGLVLPHLIVTDDELRVLPEPLSKPDGRLWDFLLGKAGRTHLQNAVYIGDDKAKDGGLAQNASVRFLHFAPKGARGYGEEESFSDWRNVPLV